MVGNDKLGIGVACGGSGEVRVRDQIGAAIPFLLDQQGGVGTLIVLRRHLDMAAVAREVLAPHRLGRKRAHDRICSLAALNRTLEADIILVDHEIDHTGHRVGAPGGRSAAGHHIHAGDHGAGQGGDVHATGQVGVHDALAVEQNQGAVDTEIAQVEQVCARRARRGRALRNAEGGRRGVDLGQLPHIIGDIGVGVAFQLFRIHHRHRRRRLETADRNARTADNDRFHIFRGCACCARALEINRVTMAVAEQPSISFCTRLFMHSPLIFCFVFFCGSAFSPRSDLNSAR